ALCFYAHPRLPARTRIHIPEFFPKLKRLDKQKFLVNALHSNPSTPRCVAKLVSTKQSTYVKYVYVLCQLGANFLLFLYQIPPLSELPNFVKQSTIHFWSRAIEKVNIFV